jgi:hypothetical protein
VDATVSSNTIVLGDARTGSLPFATVGAIHLQGGRNAQRGSIREVTIAKNDISSTVPGVLLVGGNGEGALTSGNEIAATIECNVLRQRPKASFSRFVSEIRGITLVGGLLHPRAGAEARSNRVTAVARDNLIGGRIEEPLALPNANGSEGNEVSVTPGQRP